MLEIDGLVSKYGRQLALHGVSLVLARGAIHCLLGQNGAGKSTLLQCIAGLRRIDGGTLRFDGISIAGEAAHRIGARGIALVPEERQLFDTLSVAENLLAGACARAGKAAIAADLAALYQRFPRLAHRAGQRAGTLSGGEQQMLALARAMMSRPRLLLIDEPSRGLSPLAIDDMLLFLGQIRAQGSSVLLAEQNAHLALRCADQLHLLEHGRISFSGAPAQLPARELARGAWPGMDAVPGGSGGRACSHTASTV
ncbi:ABC transporter ATP-binding protein [Oxalobacteraceae bacterium]|nr:ABC transporter ATP-binding protein [Oxalobacteraceae bacterium]